MLHKLVDSLRMRFTKLYRNGQLEARFHRWTACIERFYVFNRQHAFLHTKILQP